jgi:ParB family chromosome partitioning protein
MRDAPLKDGTDAQPVAGESGTISDIFQLNVYEIDDNPFQPRREFGQAEIDSLSESLKEHDMLQPILVRRIGERYQLISGERRLRAAIQAGWSQVPARIKDANDRLVAELAIVENLQRKDLNAIEKALSFKRYLDEHVCTQDDLAQRLKIDRSTIANLMRLLELPQRVLDAVRTNQISAGHARALLPLGEENDQTQLCNQIISKGWSVRETERRVGEAVCDVDDNILDMAGERKSKRTESDQVASLEQELRIALGTKIEIRQSKKGRGKIIVHFSDHDEFDRLRELLNGTAVLPRQDHQDINQDIA